MTGPKRVVASGGAVYLYEQDDPFPSIMTPARARALGEELIRAAEAAIRNGERARRVTPATDDDRRPER